MSHVRMERPAAPAPEWAMQYRAGDYPPFAYAGDMVRLAVDLYEGALKVHTITRRDAPFAGQVAYPGGFVDWLRDEDGRAGALREGREESQLGLPDYMETLDTYDRVGRDPRQFAGYEVDGEWVATGVRVISKAQLGLNREPLRGRAADDALAEQWISVYRFFPWEDIRSGGSARERVVRRLREYGAGLAGLDGERWTRRIDAAFGADLAEWNEERVSERFALIVEAGLAEESWRNVWGEVSESMPPEVAAVGGRSMAFDHRWMLADALERIRGKIKWLPRALASLTLYDEFAMSEVQGVVEAVSGRPVHRSNFRRLLADTTGIVEEAGGTIARERFTSAGGEQVGRAGRPAHAYRFVEALADIRLDPSMRFPFIPPSP